MGRQRLTMRRRLHTVGPEGAIDGADGRAVVAVSKGETETNGNVHAQNQSLAGTFRLTGIAPPRGQVELNDLLLTRGEPRMLTELQPAPLGPGQAESPEAKNRDVLRRLRPSWAQYCQC
jgi:hypothetical protein